MANDYLTDEQKAQFMAKLGAQEGAQDNQPSPEGDAPPADDSNAAAPADAGNAQSTPDDPTATALSELGVSSVDELVERYREVSGQSGQYKEMLTQLLAFQQALDNKGEIEPDDPLNTVKKAVREEMAPIYEKLQREAQNKIVQEAWGADAKNLPGLTDMMPEITAFIHEHPELSIANDGLKRAYEGVRSGKYKTEKELLEDENFVERMAANEKVKDAVIKEYLANAARNGDGVPASIGGGGNVPLTGKKSAPSSMDQAKSGLARMLGLK